MALGGPAGHRPVSPRPGRGDRPRLSVGCTEACMYTTSLGAESVQQILRLPWINSYWSIGRSGRRGRGRVVGILASQPTTLLATAGHCMQAIRRCMWMGMVM